MPKRVDQLPAATSVASTDLFAVATSAGTLRKINRSDLITVIKEHYDLRQHGAAGDFSTDCTAAWSSAIVALTASGGGSILLGPGSWSSDAIPPLPSKVTIEGMGRSTILVHRSAAAAGAHFLTTTTDAEQVQVRNLAINGNRSLQTNAVDAIHFDNSAGTALLNARHVIDNVHIENVKGTGLYLGSFMRACQVDKVSVYFADVYGVQLEAFADSQIGVVEVGQSGSHGWYVNGANTVEIGQARSWFSGRLLTGANGNGFHLLNGSNLQFGQALAQENSGNGFTVQAVAGLILNGLADGDNVAASTFAGFNLFNVQGALIKAIVRKHSGAAGTPSNAIALGGGTSGCTIDLAYSGLGSFPIVGADVGKNEIHLGRKFNAATFAASYTPQPYVDDTVAMTLTNNLTVNAPNMSPLIPGWRLKFVLKQDGTGTRTTTWNAVFKTLGADVTTANLTNVREFECDGTNWIQVASVLGV